eukprot:4129481-Karenia_brevis.AAC.1
MEEQKNAADPDDADGIEDGDEDAAESEPAEDAVPVVEPKRRGKAKAKAAAVALADADSQEDENEDGA